MATRPAVDKPSTPPSPPAFVCANFTRPPPRRVSRRVINTAVGRCSATLFSPDVVIVNRRVHTRVYPRACIRKKTGEGRNEGGRNEEERGGATSHTPSPDATPGYINKGGDHRIANVSKRDIILFTGMTGHATRGVPFTRGSNRKGVGARGEGKREIDSCPCDWASGGWRPLSPDNSLPPLLSLGPYIIHPTLPDSRVYKSIQADLSRHTFIHIYILLGETRPSLLRERPTRGRTRNDRVQVCVNTYTLCVYTKQAATSNSKASIQGSVSLFFALSLSLSLLRFVNRFLPPIPLANERAVLITNKERWRLGPFEPFSANNNREPPGPSRRGLWPHYHVYIYKYIYILCICIYIKGREGECGK